MVELKDGASMSDVLPALRGCKYKITYNTDDMGQNTFAGMFYNSCKGLSSHFSYNL